MDELVIAPAALAVVLIVELLVPETTANELSPANNDDISAVLGTPEKPPLKLTETKPVAPAKALLIVVKLPPDIEGEKIIACSAASLENMYDMLKTLEEDQVDKFKVPLGTALPLTTSPALPVSTGSLANIYDMSVTFAVLLNLDKPFIFVAAGKFANK
ncbi:hypothetical protein WOSG25_130060 [Weissella oryzae SG25]|uniref:Uncharacterized protein n=1 Tax=Weissella oryzae (strain DSM 25784 / JCM 18191 / LMG 30913 / SG25) TaxID=1329250 RepID=A0A069CW07_WEIOS|nr:hypothetical protein WOSG25_130060 [Weissella oryzae SG25]